MSLIISEPHFLFHGKGGACHNAVDRILALYWSKKDFVFTPILMHGGYAEDWGWCPGPSQPIQLIGHGQGMEKGMRDHLASWGLRVGKVASTSNASSPLAARFCFNCKGREKWRRALLCPHGTCFPTAWDGQNLPNVTGKDVHPLQGPEVPFFAVIYGFIISRQTKALCASTSSLGSGDDLKLGPTIGVSREMGNLFWKLLFSSVLSPHLHPPPKGLFSC